MVGPTNELWKIDIQGNYAEKLKALGAEIQGIRSGFNNLKASMVAAGAEFKKPAEEIKKLSGTARVSAENAQRVRAEFVQLATNAQVLGRAYSSIAKETNKLNTTRTVELQILEQTKRKQDPLLIQLRAEAGAIKRVTAALQKQVEEKRFAELAAEAGLEIEEKSVKVFNAEAEALERIAKAAQEAEIAKELQARGFDASGNPSIPDSFNGALTAEGRAKAEDAANSRLAKLEADNLTKSKLLQNKVYLDGIKRSKELQQQMEELTKTTDKSKSATNRFLFTFRRLIGVMALFTVARVVTREFNNMVAGAIKFQAEIEATRVGLAGLIAASASIRSPLGDKVGIDQQLLLSQQIAIDQMEKLRLEALQTAASYTELSAAFQNAVAPGLQSGLTLDQIRKVTVNISQAATGLGLAQDQLAEEIRSLFTGAISARNTRIATALGITPADINRAKELGNLFEFLDQRFAAISKTGKLLMSTFTAQLSNATDAFKQLLATSSTPLFEQLKGGLQDLQKAIFTTTEDAIQFDPKTLAAFKDLFQGLAQGVANLRVAFSKLDLTGVGYALSVVGQSLGLAFSIAANAIVIFTNAINPVLGVFKLVLSVVNSLLGAFKLLPGPLQTVFSVVSGTYLKAVAFLVVTKKLTSLWYSLLPVFAKIRSFMVTTVAASAAMPGPLRVINTLLSGMVLRLALISKVMIVVVALAVVLDVIIRKVSGGKGLFDYISQGLDTALGGFRDATEAAKGLKEELGGNAKTPFGIPVNEFRELKGAFQEASQEMILGIRKGALELRQSLGSIGLSGAIAQQIAGATQIQIELETDKTFVETDRRIRELQGRLNKLGGAEAGERAKAINQERKSTESLVSVLERARNVEKERARNSKVFDNKNATGQGVLVNVEEDLKTLQQLVDEFGVENLADNLITKRLVGTDAILDSVRQRLRLLNTEAEKLTEARVIADQIGDLEAEKKKVEALALVKKAQSLIASGSADLFSTLNNVDFLSGDIEAAAAAADIATGSEVLRAEAAAKTAALQQKTIKANVDIAVIVKDIAALEERRAAHLADVNRLSQSLTGLTDDEKRALTDAAAVLDEQIKAKEQLITLQQSLNEEQQREAFNVAKLADLRANGSFTQGLGKGLLDFKQQNSSLFDVGSQFATGALTSFSQLGGTAIASLFDPNTNFELQEAAGQLALQLGTDLVTQMIQNLLASLIPSSLASSLGFRTAATGLTAAGGALTSAAAAWGPVVLGLSAVAKELAAAATVKAGASVVSAGSAKGGKVTSSSPRFRGPASAFAGAKGFARGGFAGKDARDTIPAWLRPNEWVIRPEAVAYYGDRLFHLLNTRRLDAGALSGIAGTARGVSPSIRAVSKVGYATGGKVASSAPRGGVQTVVVANYYDEQTMDRSLAAGGNAQLRFTRTKRAQYLASLGLSPGG